MNASTLTTAPTGARPMHYLPVALFGASMGLTGLSVAWRLAHVRFGVPEAISQCIAAVAGLAFAVLLAAYGVKAAFAPDAVRAEFKHPVAGHMFGLFIANLLLLPIVLAPLSLAFARALWVVGAVLMLVFMVPVAGRWATGLRQARESATPAWIVPAVGLLDVPLAAPALHLPASWHAALTLCWAVGLAMSVLLLAAVGARLLFGTPLPAPMQPTLLILVAPAAVGASSHAALSGGHSDLLALGLFGAALPLLVVLVAQLRRAWRAPFKTIWWATSFPLAACVIASLQIAAAFRSRVADGLAALLLAFASIVVAWLLFHTLRGVGQGRLREIV